MTPAQSLDTAEAAARDLREVVEGLVDRPADVDVEAVDEGDGFFFEITTARSDAGKVIGREGRTIQALRDLVTARAAADGERYDLDLLD
jgi:predicted RNA-binding protein YlqC (UPF0109 family)